MLGVIVGMTVVVTTGVFVAVLLFETAFTVTLHLYFFFFTTAKMYVFPFLLPLTTPFWETEAIFLFLVDHFTFCFVPFIFKVTVFPTFTDTEVLFNFILDAASIEAGCVRPVANVAVKQNANNWCFFLWLCIKNPPHKKIRIQKW